MAYRFCYQESVSKGAPAPCTAEIFQALLNAPAVEDICRQIASLDKSDAQFEEKKSALKKSLPIIIPHAYSFANDRRISADATPSGLAMVDVDHIANPRDVYTLQVEPIVEEQNIYFAAVTPSGHGLRLIAERNIGETIEAAQQRIAGACGFDEIDGVTTDLARASYLIPASYVLYMNDNGLFNFQTEEAEEYWSTATSVGIVGVTEESVIEAQAEEPSAADSYKGLPYSRIVERLLMTLCPDGNVSFGERNTVFFSLAIHMRYICDFNAAQLLRILPDFGLTEQERKQAIHSAIGRPRKSECPVYLQSVLTLVEQEMQQEAESEDFKPSSPMSLPRLPRLLQVICRRLPAEYRQAMIIASLPVLGTLATRIRFNYLDEQEHSLSFFSIITAPAASGKSFLRRPLELLLTPINEQDEVERAKEQTYKEKLRACKNSKNQPEDPHACPRNNGIAISVAKLLELLSFGEGKHLFGFSEEIDSLVKSEKAGVWSQKNDIYRMAFDNSEYGQAYKNDQSFCGKVRVFYNLLLTGTPRSLNRFFKEDNVENGLMTRTCIAQLPDTSYSKMPKFEPYTEREQAEIIRWARMLDQEDGFIQCTAVEQAIDQWQEEKRQRALDADSHAADILRRRAAVIGYRAGMLCYLLEGRANKKSVGEFAVYVAEVVFRNQFALYGEQLEQALTSQEESTERGAATALIDLLPKEFTKKDLIALRAKKGQSVKPNAVATLLHRWKQSGRVEQISSTAFRKL